MCGIKKTVARKAFRLHDKSSILATIRAKPVQAALPEKYVKSVSCYIGFSSALSAYLCVLSVKCFPRLTFTQRTQRYAESAERRPEA